MTHEPEMQI